MDLSADPHAAQRLNFRQQSRSMVLDPRQPEVHLARVKAALLLAGTEPVQGALADMFIQLGPQHAEHKNRAYQAGKSRLVQRISLLFESLVAANPLPTITPLATRWSLLAIPTADVPARGRRCSLDDSRTLALQALQSFVADDAAAQQAFLDHCVTCHDKMAFMLARRAVLKHIPRLPDSWQRVCDKLEGL
jgi:hypothetical protein